MTAAALFNWAAGLRYNIAQARTDLEAMIVESPDHMYHQGYQCGRIAEMERAADLVDVLMANGADSQGAVTVDFAHWARWPEVQTYASRHGITDAEAVRHLVNCGLSHQ